MSTKWGYKYITVNGVKILEHRHVVECFLCRKLTSSEIVHHINGDKKDNRIDNLDVLTTEEHMRLHLSGVKKSEETRLKMSIAKKNMSDLTRARFSIAKKGIKKSEESKLKMSLAVRKDYNCKNKHKYLNVIKKLEEGESPLRVSLMEDISLGVVYYIRKNKNKYLK